MRWAHGGRLPHPHRHRPDGPWAPARHRGRRGRVPGRVDRRDRRGPARARLGPGRARGDDRRPRRLGRLRRRRFRRRRLRPLWSGRRLVRRSAAGRRPGRRPPGGPDRRWPGRGAADHEPVMTTLTHHELRIALFGGHVAVLVDDEDDAAARAGLRDAEARLREWHARLTRFEPDSELSRLNRDARASVPASPMLLDLADAVPWAGALSGGLVDATQLRALERAGYARTFSRVRGGGPGPIAPSGAGLLPRRPAGPDPHRRWGRVVADRARGAVRRPPGVRLDSGGLGKGLAAD